METRPPYHVSPSLAPPRHPLSDFTANCHGLNARRLRPPIKSIHVWDFVGSFDQIIYSMNF